MSGISAVNNLIEAKLMDLHTAFVARIVSVKNGKADVQPLNMIKQYGKQAKRQAIVKEVPILTTVYKIKLFDVEFPDPKHPAHKHGGHVKFVPIQAGDIVFCVCADRDISNTQSGSHAVPAYGRHEIKDAVIVGLLSTWEGREST